jgi:hypothetical protein
MIRGLILTGEQAIPQRRAAGGNKGVAVGKRHPTSRTDRSPTACAVKATLRELVELEHDCFDKQLFAHIVGVLFPLSVTLFLLTTGALRGCRPRLERSEEGNGYRLDSQRRCHCRHQTGKSPFDPGRQTIRSRLQPRTRVA